LKACFQAGAFEPGRLINRPYDAPPEFPFTPGELFELEGMYELGNPADERNVGKVGSSSRYGQYPPGRYGRGGNQFEKSGAVTLLQAMSLQFVERKSPVDGDRQSNVFKNKRRRNVRNEVPDIDDPKAHVDLGRRKH
jgi:hypothetical protein